MRRKNRITSLWLAAAIILFSACLFAQTDQEAAELAKRMRITVSRFFREQERWETLAQTVMPQLRQRVE